jgi:hypothetical protein
MPPAVVAHGRVGSIRWNVREVVRFTYDSRLKKSKRVGHFNAYIFIPRGHPWYGVEQPKHRPSPMIREWSYARPSGRGSDAEWELGWSYAYQWDTDVDLKRVRAEAAAEAKYADTMGRRRN